jgi:pimeloyl-ACP methyl ester carboxylesterase
MGDTFKADRQALAENYLMNPGARARFLAVEQTPEQKSIAVRNRETTALLGWDPRFHNPDLRKWLHRIDIPAHVVWAEDDRVFPRPYGDALTQLIPDATFTELPGTGHLMQVDDPEAFCAAVSAFIANIEAATNDK